MIWYVEILNCITFIRRHIVKVDKNVLYYTVKVKLFVCFKYHTIKPYSLFN